MKKYSFAVLGVLPLIASPLPAQAGAQCEKNSKARQKAEWLYSLPDRKLLPPQEALTLSRRLTIGGQQPAAKYGEICEALRAIATAETRTLTLPAEPAPAPSKAAPAAN